MKPLRQTEQIQKTASVANTDRTGLMREKSKGRSSKPHSLNLDHDLECPLLPAEVRFVVRVHGVCGQLEQHRPVVHGH